MMPPPGPFATLPPGDGPARSGAKGHPHDPAIRCIVSTEWFGETKQSASTKGTIAIDTKTAPPPIEAIIAGLEDLMRSLAEMHAPEFLEIAVTMPQAKLLYLLGVSGEMHMSVIVVRLGVSLSTVSGLVDRVVDHGLATRREDPADRRQVVVSLTDAAPPSSIASASSTPARCASCSASSPTTSWSASATPSTPSPGPRPGCRARRHVTRKEPA